jgi:hypothetical protein
MLIKNLSLGAVSLSVFTAVLAQTASPALPALPALPAASAASADRINMANQPSAFKNYRAFKADDPLQDWRAANDAMEQLGGHMGHVRNKQVASDNAQMAAPKAKP